ncbi:MAG: hypothetical protein ACLVCU_12090, partial [Gallintestinimicrobium sp.]|uniref:hypothetical protein n=1 Tax=Gallintestinimicrobium sp. TaxID=2981655 RepID=UPI003999D063
NQKKSKLMQTKGQLMKSLHTAFSFAPPSILSLTICFSISHSNYTIKPVNNSTAALDYMRKVRTVFCPDFLAQS